MDVWQTEAAEEVTKFICGLLKVEKVSFGGSMLDEDLLDVFSDVDSKFWFISFLVLVKLGRGDYLIASHLALELCQLDIVIQMLARDNIKNTNVPLLSAK